MLVSLQAWAALLGFLYDLKEAALEASDPDAALAQASDVAARFQGIPAHGFKLCSQY